jgi:hypothetical protein
MYKLSVDHTKIFYDFFASTVGFWENSAEFSAKPAGIQKNSAELSVNSADNSFNSTEFRISKIFLFLSHINYISAKFFQFLMIFFKIFKIRRNQCETIFHCQPNFVTLIRRCSAGVSVLAGSSEQRKGASSSGWEQQRPTAEDGGPTSPTSMGHLNLI